MQGVFLREIMMITGTTRVFGVIADPIDHVRAPMVFNPVFEDRKIDAVLVPLHIPAHDLEKSIRGLAALPNMGGVCVTIPHKLPMANLCDDLSLAAQITGAVNAVRFDQGRLIGENFDGAGFVSGLIGEGHDLTDANVLMIGAGGAARAIAVALAGQPIGQLTIANRTLANADAIATILREHFPQLTIQTIEMAKVDAVLPAQDVIVNTTSLGLKDDDEMPCSLEGVDADVIIADIIMVPEKTAWLLAAEKKGLKTHAGKHMLDYQRDLIGRFLNIL